MDVAKRENRLPAGCMEKCTTRAIHVHLLGRRTDAELAGNLIRLLDARVVGRLHPRHQRPGGHDLRVPRQPCGFNGGLFPAHRGLLTRVRINAKRIYGCRGYFSHARASNTCLLLHWGGWQGLF